MFLGYPSCVRFALGSEEEGEEGDHCDDDEGDAREDDLTAPLGDGSPLGFGSVAVHGSTLPLCSAHCTGTIVPPAKVPPRAPHHEECRHATREPAAVHDGIGHRASQDHVQERCAQGQEVGQGVDREGDGRGRERLVDPVREVLLGGQECTQHQRASLTWGRWDSAVSVRRIVPATFCRMPWRIP